MSKITVRAAKRADATAIFNLKLGFAQQENLEHLLQLSPQELERDGFDVDRPCYKCLVAEITNSNTESINNELSIPFGNKRIVGYAIYYDIYPVWEGRGLMLEDLYVSEDFRDQGIGKLLLQELGKIGVKGNYSRITLECQKRNTAGNFLKKNYGVDVTESENWHALRFSTEAVHKLAKH